MASPSSEIQVRKKLITYGKSRRKINPERGFSSITHTSSSKRQASGEKNSKNEANVTSLPVESSCNNLQRAPAPKSSSKDIYEISSDEDSLELTQTHFKSILPKTSQLKINGREEIKSAYNLLVHPNSKKEINQLFELPKAENKTSQHTGLRLGIVENSGYSQSNFEISSKIKAVQANVRTKQDTQNACSKSGGNNGLPHVKRKHTKPSAKIQDSTITPQKNFDIYEIPSSDDEKLSSRASQKMPVTNNTSNMETAAFQNSLVTKKGSKKKLKLSPSDEPRLKSKSCAGSKSCSPTVHDTRTCEKAESSSHPIQVKKKQVDKSHWLENIDHDEIHKSRSSSLTSSLDEVRINQRQKRLSPKTRKIWRDLLGPADDEDSSISENSNVARSSILFTPSSKIDTGLSKPLGITNTSHSNTLTAQRVRIIDSLFQNYTNSASSNESLSVDVETDEESALISPCQKICSTVEKETTNSPTSVSEKHSKISQGLGPKFTYSQQRSMLVEEDLAKDFDPEFTTSIQPMGGRKNRRGSIPNLGPLLRLNEEEEEDGGQAVIQNIHELRKSGSIKRFLDECTDLFDRIGSPGKDVPTRRSGLLDLALKMREVGFVQQFRVNSMEQQLFVSLHKENDTISGYLIMCMLVIILGEGPMAHIVHFLSRQGIVQLLNHLIDDETSIPDIIKDRKLNISQTTKSLMIEQHNFLLQSDKWEKLEVTFLSARTITLKFLNLITQQARESEELWDIISEELTAKLFRIMKSISNEKLWEPSKNRKAVDLALAAACLQTHCNSISKSPDEPERIDELLQLLADVLEQSLCRSSNLSDIHFTILKMTLQLTNNNKQATEIFARPSLLLLLSSKIVHQFHAIYRYQTEEEFPWILDYLSLLLGILMNFSEWSPRIREYLQDFHKLKEDPLKEMICIFEDRSEKISQVSN